MHHSVLVFKKSVLVLEWQYSDLMCENQANFFFTHTVQFGVGSLCNRLSLLMIRHIKKGTADT